MWDRWISLLLRCYPRQFRDQFGEDLRAQYRHTTPPSLTAAIVAVKDLGIAGLGARLDDARRAWGTRTPSGLDALTSPATIGSIVPLPTKTARNAAEESAPAINPQ